MNSSILLAFSPPRRRLCGGFSSIKQEPERRSNGVAIANVKTSHWTTQDDDLLAVNEVLDQFGREYPEHVALVKLRYFAGMTTDEAAASLEISASTADRRWAFARAWLKNAMQKLHLGEIKDFENS